MTRVHALLMIAYPGLVYLGLRIMEPRYVAWVAVGLAGTRALLSRREQLIEVARMAWPMALAFVVAVVPSAIWNDPLGILLTPTLVSFSLMAVFAHSLLRPPSAVERIARLQVPMLGEAEVRYCARVTTVWAAFFLLNGLGCAVLALTASRELWALYTGGIAYALIGLLYGAEYVYRHWRFRRYLGGPLDFLLMRLFPPPSQRPAALPLDPEILARRQGPGTRELDLRVPERLACWPGHFPELPIVPGVLQLRWVMAELERSLGPRGRLARIERLKFKQLIRPGDALTLRLRQTAETERVSFELVRGAESLAEGELHFEAHA